MVFAMLLLALALSLSAQAHKPAFSGDYDSPDEAWVVRDPEISIVLYQEITCELPVVWLTLEGEADFPLYIQLGVPVIDRLADYRPSVALVAPGLPEPETDLPFDLPDGSGIMVFDTDDVEEPDDFYEPFTQTESWVWVEETVELPETGTAWLVAWHPGNQTGKLWVATGTVEDFSDVEPAEFVEWSAAVKDFHEVDPAVQAAAPPERVCETDADDMDELGTDGDGSSSEAAKGCATLAMSSLGWGGVAWAMAGVARRRRS
jgi:hypothetical protein